MRSIAMIRLSFHTISSGEEDDSYHYKQYRIQYYDIRHLAYYFDYLKSCDFHNKGALRLGNILAWRDLIVFKKKRIECGMWDYLCEED